MRRLPSVLLVVLLMAAAAATAWFVATRPRLTESEAQVLVASTLIEEVPESFLVVGTLTYQTRVERSRRRSLVAVPGVMELPLGRTRVSARVPGRVSYGFDVRALRPADVRLAGDTVVVRLPPLEVFSVEANLAAAEIETDEGWGPLLSPRGYLEERAALRAVRPRMQAQAERHLARSGAPERHAARAVAAMLRPAFLAAGYAPTLTFVVDDGRTLTLPSPAREGS